MVITGDRLRLEYGPRLQADAGSRGRRPGSRHAVAGRRHLTNDDTGGCPNKVRRPGLRQTPFDKLVSFRAALITERQQPIQQEPAPLHWCSALSIEGSSIWLPNQTLITSLLAASSTGWASRWEA
jgi:hypothetical protein